MESFAADLRYQPRTPLQPEHVDALRAIGDRTTLPSGAYLARAGDPMDVFAYVVEGRLDLVDPITEEPYLPDGLGPGQFAGEMGFLYRGTWTRSMRATQDTQLLTLCRQRMLDLMAQVPEISDIVVEVFNARRRRQLESNDTNLTLIGSEVDAAIQAVEQFAARSRIPFRSFPIDSPEGAEAAAVCGLDAGSPAVIMAPDRVVTPATPQTVAALMGLDLGVEENASFDVLIVGGGPAGVAAAVYAGAEGLSALLIDEIAVGGQAGTSSRIENYLGFPTGISGADLLWRGQVQAMKFGTLFAMPRRVTKIVPNGEGAFTATVDDNVEICCRSMIVATGVQYRRLPLERLEFFEGNGVFYAATDLEARHCAGKDVAIIGGGNSAGQAAMHLSRYAGHVYLLVRGQSLAASMSEYLSSRLNADPRITILYGHQVVALHGESRLETITVSDRQTGDNSDLDVGGLFVMAGAAPNTSWLEDLIQLDDRGFVLTGAAVGKQTALETSTDGIFAVGDVRSGSVKRVASAAGEGSVVISSVWSHVNQ
ncbi:MAG: FAD-dependent oxidoreductase [Congregibacter sp.]